MRVYIRFHRYQDEARPQLRDTELTGVQHLPVRQVAQILQFPENLLTVASEPRGRKAPDVLKHHRSRLTFRDQAQCLRKQVALVISTELLARYRERRARNPAGQEVNTAVGIAVEVMDVHLGDLPLRPVQAQCLAGVRVNLDSLDMGELRVL